MRVLLADTTVLVKNNSVPQGHGLTVARNYYSALKDKVDIKVAGGKAYKKYIKDTFVLPFAVDVTDGSLAVKFKGIINTLLCLLYPCDTIIFQNQNISSVLFTLSKIKTKKNIYIIYYYDPIENARTEKEAKLFLKVQDKIKGILTSFESFSEGVKPELCIVPDYFPVDTESEHTEVNRDFTILGTISWAKDVEMVITALNNTKYKCLIAGSFADEERKNNLQKIATDNIEIKDEYLTEEEYSELLNKTKYIVLPYNQEHYKVRSSGVVLESLYARIPVIVPDIKTFEFVKDFNVGLTYKSSMSEVLDDSESKFEELKNNVDKYIMAQRLKVDELVKFLHK